MCFDLDTDVDGAIAACCGRTITLCKFPAHSLLQGTSLIGVACWSLQAVLLIAVAAYGPCCSSL